MSNLLRIATRNSPLALWQAQYVANTLEQQNPDLKTELVPMTTSGDRFLNTQTNGGKGLFVKELEEALLYNQADLAVHSMKDMPAFQPDGLEIVAITARENPFDAFVSAKYTKLEDLPLHATVGTSSLRRQSQLLAQRSDLKLIPIRGNIQTRLEKMRTLSLDAIVLAAAGLIRMNLQDQIQQILSQDVMLPACGQGALGVECRTDDVHARSYLAKLHDFSTAVCVHTERKVSQNLGGNCQVPLAVYCHFANAHQLVLHAKVLSPDGQTMLTASCTALHEQAESLAQDCTEQLLVQGAQRLLNNSP